jgi:molybdenum cofactor cytidylyltransferase
VTTAGVVLAAGCGARFRGSPNKMTAPFRGKPLVLWAVEAAMDADFDKVFVVTGAADLRRLLPYGVDVVPNGNWPDGLATSLRAGIGAAADGGHDTIVVGLGDQPLIPSSAWRAVAETTDKAVTVATYGGKRRNPVRLHRSVWHLLPQAGEMGARVLFRERPDLVCEVACEGEAADVDTVEDLKRWS